MKFCLHTLLLIILVTTSVAVPAAPAPDWQRIGGHARAHSVPVVVLVTSEDCGHCERLRRGFLATPEARALLSETAVLGELSRDTGGKFTDFDGERVRAQVFLGRYDIFATSTLLFLDDQGRTLTPALVGFSQPEDYLDLLTERLERAESALRAARLRADNRQPLGNR